MRKKRPIPMPTKEEVERAKLKAAAADPLVWAMKSVDDKFPDEREKDEKTVQMEAEVEEVPVDDEYDEEYDEEFEEEFGDESEENEDLLDDSDILSEPDAESSVKMINKISELKKKSEEKREAEVKKVEPKTLENPAEIQAEGKLAMPTDDGVVTMEVKPMRQNVSDVSPEEVKKVSREDIKVANADNSVKGANLGKTAKATKAGSKFESKFGKMKLDFAQKKVMIGFAVLTILAVVGVSFGVIATVKQSQAAEEISSQIAAVETEDNDVDGDYINIKDWRVKIKIVDGLNNVSYNLFTDDYAEVQIWGSKKDISANYVPDFAKQNKNSSPLGTMVRVPRYERAAAGRLIWYDDYYNYYYQGPSGVPSVSEDEMSWWVESYLLIKEMLTNADNYTTE